MPAAPKTPPDQVSLMALMGNSAGFDALLEYLEEKRTEAFAKYTDLANQAVFDPSKLDAAKAQFGAHRAVNEIYDHLVSIRMNNGKTTKG